MIGTTVGSYRVTQKVSVGGMGTVYRAEHALIGKPAAVKVLHPELRNNPEVVQRFLNEAKATTQIKHPGIVEIFDFGYLESGDGYIVMEFLEGMSLARRLETGGKMEEGEAAVLMRSVCSALAAAHAKGIIHRDLKPDNVFLCPDPEAPTGERPKLLDFGIAKLDAALGGLGGPVSATKTGAVMGTPTYMSPEQCRGTGELDARSDLYSIGCMFYEMVAGRPPFENMAAGELIGAHLFIEPESPKSVGAPISDAADALVMQLLQKVPAKRVQTAHELARRFAELAQGKGFASRVTPIPTANHKITQPDPPRSSAEGVAPTLPSDPGLSSSPRISAPASSAVPAATTTSQPTTLSGAASQSVIRPPRSRAPMIAGLAAAFLVAAGGAFFFVSNKSKPSAAPSTQPSEAGRATGDEPAAPVADPAPTAVTDPAPTPPPAPETPATAEPPATATTEPTEPEPPPSSVTTATAAKAVAKPHKPKRPKPADKPKPTADKGKPGDKAGAADKPKPPDKPKPAPGILIETDL